MIFLRDPSLPFKEGIPWFGTFLMLKHLLNLLRLLSGWAIVSNWGLLNPASPVQCNVMIFYTILQILLNFANFLKKFPKTTNSEEKNKVPSKINKTISEKKIWTIHLLKKLRKKLKSKQKIQKKICKILKKNPK